MYQQDLASRLAKSLHFSLPDASLVGLDFDGLINTIKFMSSRPVYLTD